MKTIRKRKEFNKPLKLFLIVILLLCALQCKAQSNKELIDTSNKFIRVTVYNYNSHNPTIKKRMYEHYFIFISSDSAICYFYITPIQKYDCIVFKKESLSKINNIVDSILSGKVNLFSSKNFQNGLYSEIKVETKDTVFYIKSRQYQYTLLPSILSTDSISMFESNYSIYAPLLFFFKTYHNKIESVPFAIVSLFDKKHSYAQEINIFFNDNQGFPMMRSFFISQNGNLLKNILVKLNNCQLDFINKELSKNIRNNMFNGNYFEIYYYDYKRYEYKKKSLLNKVLSVKCNKIKYTQSFILIHSSGRVPSCAF